MPDACGRVKTVGQTLFLGASVVSVNMNLGWGDTASSVSVELVEDFQPISCYRNNVPIDPFLPDVRNYADNHYYDCCANSVNFDCPDNCYVDEFGEVYNSLRVDANGRSNPPKEKNVPGKIYYVWTSAGVVSRYWYEEDPGFFGTGTRVNPDGSLSRDKSNIYNIINVPVFFKFDNLTFTGIIKSWDRNFNNGKNFYKIEIESVSSLLKNSWMIVDGYAGAVFSYSPGATYGAPRNYTGENLNSVGTIQSGNIHNLFNVYGFLESLGPYGFGGSNKNDNGISYRKLIQGLKILTSSSNVGDLYWKSKNMFSPFGRILGKTMQKIDNSSYSTITPLFSGNAFGVIPPKYDYNGIPRVEFVLDLSELIIPPEDIRFETSNKVIRVGEFIQNLVEKNGQQSYWVTGQSLIDQSNNLPYNVIKIKAVNRTQYSRPYQVAQTISAIQNSGYPATTSSDGQTRNDEAKVRTVYFGGNQQRLYQAKNYRLAFNQNNYIWDPVNLKFVNYRRFDSVEKDKVKVPLGLSTRNPTLNLTVIPNPYFRVLNTDETIRNVITSTFFYNNDTVWSDSLVESNDVSCIKQWRMRDFPIDPNTGYSVSGIPSSLPNGDSAYSIIGNYQVILTNDGSPYLLPVDKLPKPSTAAAQDPTFGSSDLPQPPTTIPSSGTVPPTGVVNQSGRFIPLYKDVISPFFGFKYERTIPISDSNIHRYIRPVWLDTWTGQISVAFDLIEAPPVSCGPMVSLYNKDVFGPNAINPPDNRNGLSDPTAETSSTSTTTSVPVNNPQTIPSSGSSPTNSLGVRTNSSYEGLGFLVTETEMRAALSGIDSYLQYCQAKMPVTKPDLYVMLLNCWKNKGVSIKGVITPDLRQGLTLNPAEALASNPNHNIGAIGIAGSAGQPTKLTGAQSTKMANTDFSMLMQPGFLEDLRIIVEFIADIGNKYYGRQYMVKLPSVLSYRDQQYSGISIPGFNNGRIFVYSGSGKIFYNYEPVDGAWEEAGNYIDNSIIVGGPQWRMLSDDKGLIPNILGFNVSDKIDYVRKAWCLLTALQKAQTLSQYRNEAVALSTTLNSFSNIFSADRPMSGNLAEWTIRVRRYVDLSVGEEPGLGSGEQGSNIEWITLDGTETEEYLKQHLTLSNEQWAAYNQFAELTRKIKAVYQSMPSQIECFAEEELVETVTEDNGYPCVPGNLPPGKSIDDYYIDTGARYPNPNVQCPIVSRNDTRYTSPAYKPKTTQINALTKIYANDKSFLIPGIDYSKLDGDGKNYVIVNTNPFNDAFGSGVCGGGKKLYMKASLDNNGQLAFGNPFALSDPRAIISISKPIELSQTSLAYAQDPNKFVMPNVAAEDIAYYRNAYAAGSTAYSITKRNQPSVVLGTGLPLTPDEQNRLQYLEAKYLTPLIAKDFLITPGSTSNASADHRSIAPKAAQPFFAAIPLKSNKYSYGPWTNYPDFSKSRVFDYVTNASSIIENLTDSIEVKYNPDYVPWNYGGMSFLDQAVLYEIESNENYQVIQERGSIKIVGPPVFTVGGHFSDQLLNALQSPFTVSRENIQVDDYPEPGTFYNSYNYNIVKLNDRDTSAFGGYPIIQSLSVSVGTDGISTSYNLGTYNPKYGLYNKERIQQNQKLSKDVMSLYAKITSSNNQSQEQFRSQVYKMLTDQQRFGEAKMSSQPTALFGNSPTELLIGQSRYFLPDPGSGSPPQYLTDLNSDNIASGIMSRGFRHESWAGIFTADEVGAEIMRDYSNKSAMSLDGIFSPISFYPTAFNATYSLSNYNSAKFLIKNNVEKEELRCVLCDNSRVIEDDYIDYSSSSRTSTTIKYPCPACCRSRVSVVKGSGIPNDNIPRVVIDPKNTKSEINFYTLNPIVVSAGEFRNWNSPSNKPNQTDIINDKHSIRVVARGENLIGPEYNLDTTRNLTYSNDILNPDYEAYDYELAKIRGTGIYPLNQRFFGFRGPMMLHGWGYDTDGYPVPNLYDEPEAIDNYGRCLRFQLDSNGFNDLTKPGLYITNNSDILLGDIITKRYEWKNNKWVRKSTPSKYFGTNWASKPNTWPVGPIDLRWDHNRRVWTGGGNGCGEEKLPPYIITNSTDSDTLVEYLNTKPSSSCPYKMVYITLEQDLTRPNNLYYYSNAVRAYIDDLEYKADTLPVGFRRLVYVIDRSGYTAPAGSRLYCKYNPDLGFYEPISKPTVITTGVIVGSQARIDLIYAKGRLSNNIPNTVVNFANPLAFYVAENSKGIFSYIDGTWTLTAVN